jgi:hypothetical protein
MKTLLLVGVSCLLLAPPAMSATTYTLGLGGAGQTGLDYTGDTPQSAESGGDGGVDSGAVSGVHGGSSSVFASYGASDPRDCCGIIGEGAGAQASVTYTMRISGPATGALRLVPIVVSETASAGSISGIPADGSLDVEADDGASVTLFYASPPPNAPALPQVRATTFYDSEEPTRTQLLGTSDSFTGVVMFAANEDIEVQVQASALVLFRSTLASAAVNTAAAADPTFEIDDPAFADYTIEGVPAGPAAAAAPEPATWAIMLIGFAGLGVFSYRRTRVAASQGLASSTTQNVKSVLSRTKLAL